MHKSRDAKHWIVVCDGRKALILENIGDDKFPNLSLKEALERPSAATHEQGTAPPGRTHQPVGRARSAVSQTDWHDDDEFAFLTELAGRLAEKVEKRGVRRLTLVAPPRALGMFRKARPPALGKLIDNEIGKDLVKAPIGEIERQVFAPVITR